MLHLQLATSSSGKLREFRAAVARWVRLRYPSPALEIDLLPGFNSLPSCEEDADTFAGNAVKKALHYSQLAPGYVLADDSGIEVDFLHGAPGIYSRRFAGPTATDAENNSKLLRELQGVMHPQRTARFVCELALAMNQQIVAQFRGAAEGVILESPRGEAGFGYDPLFLDPVTGKTFAELSPEAKLERSHRGRAIQLMLAWLAAHPEL
ncbi:MAG: hypothetical protein A3F68_03145 [Acidobacteria bacterium RIFCSPLOWO2_12_FULL_54_10]|nr:MAG: hypothetical protein A3F68_03145 [Acidobacteria bacterium RIFCSPLOWO2_12_FULL_54_10]